MKIEVDLSGNTECGDTEMNIEVDWSGETEIKIEVNWSGYTEMK